ncbi:MAG: hypothetical protein ACOC6R_00235 [Chloroflexota bacterium]
MKEYFPYRITSLGSNKLEKDGKRLQNQVVTLKTAIEEAISKGQKSMDGLSDISRSRLVSNKDVVLTHMNAGSEVVG